MNRTEFLARLRAALVSLPFEEGQSAMKYYEEYFADAGEDREEEILKELGSPEMLAATILGGYSSAPVRFGDARAASSANYGDPRYSAAPPYSSDQREQAQEPWYRRTPLWILIPLAICLVPIILPIFGAAVGLFGGLLGVAVAVVISIIAFCLSGVIFGVAGIVMVVVGALRMVLSPAIGLMTAGVGLLLLAVGILLAVTMFWIFTQIVPSAIRGFTDLVRRILHKGGASK